MEKNKSGEKTRSITVTEEQYAFFADQAKKNYRNISQQARLEIDQLIRGRAQTEGE